MPLDPNYPPARLELMLEVTAAPVIVTTGGLADRLPVRGATVVRLDELIDGRPPSEWTAPRVHPDNIAYTMFTSGSTGVPKGVAVRHAGIVRLAQDPTYVQLDDTEVVLHLSSISFDAATFEIWVRSSTAHVWLSDRPDRCRCSRSAHCCARTA